MPFSPADINVGTHAGLRVMRGERGYRPPTGWIPREQVFVRQVEDDGRILFDWNDEDPTTVEFRFVPWTDAGTYVQITETGFGGDGDEIVAHVAASTGGFYQVLCAAKALLEHDVDLGIVRDQGSVHASPPRDIDL